MATSTDAELTLLNEDLGSLFIGYTACCMCVISSSFSHKRFSYCDLVRAFDDEIGVATVCDGVVFNVVEGRVAP